MTINKQLVFVISIALGILLVIGGTYWAISTILSQGKEITVLNEYKNNSQNSIVVLARSYCYQTSILTSGQIICAVDEKGNPIIDGNGVIPLKPKE